MTENEWRDIPSFPLYQANVKGEIRNVKTGKVLKPHVNVHGYVAINLRQKGRYRCKLLHRLLAEVFIPKPEGKTEVNHKDLDRANYSLDNLEWVTSSENKRYSLRRGRGRGACLERQLAILTFEGSAYYSQSMVAKLFGVSRNMVQKTKKNFYA